MKNKYILFKLIILLFFNVGINDLSFSKNAKNDPIRIKDFNLSTLEWKLWGYRPESWKNDFNFSEFKGPKADYSNISVKVPGSVQKALKDAGIIKDWNIGNNSISAEWIENRHWIFVTKLPDDWLLKESSITLKCKGLDDNGIILINGKEVGKFNNAFIPYKYDITSFLKDRNNTLAIVFECPPANLGQIGYTSKIKDWKPRFYYGWDWMPRIVQIGIWDDLVVEIVNNDQMSIESLKVVSQADRVSDIGQLHVSGEMTSGILNYQVRIQMKKGTDNPIIDETFPITQLRDGKSWNDLKIRRWWPNGSGDQTLYDLVCTLYDQNGIECQNIEKKVGFKNVEWLPCKDAPPAADPWLCSINGKPVFLQGVNWTPIRPNFADLKEMDYRNLLTVYKNLGINIIRIWGGGFAEKDWLYDICDEMGILIWQDFPLSSSGLDNEPPKGQEEINSMVKIVTHYVERLNHHVSLLLWCGGNELYDKVHNLPVDDQHPMIKEIKMQLSQLDPIHRFVTGSPSGPEKWGGWDNFGKGVNWDVHGPWRLPFNKNDRTMKSVIKFWELDDALMHSEVGVPGAMSAEMINKYRGDLCALPANMDNPLWRPVSWWIEWDEFLSDHNGKWPLNLEEYVTWSQERQTTGLCIALQKCKSRFPKCGGFIIWMGHDSYPCPINTSIIDFDGNLKPVAHELSKIWKADN